MWGERTQWKRNIVDPITKNNVTKSLFKVDEIILTFRKAFRDVFKNDLVFILTSGLIFGGLHVLLSLSSAWDLFYLIPYCSLGIAFAKMYKESDNIFTSIMMHMFHNTALTIISVIGIGAIILW